MEPTQCAPNTLFLRACRSLCMHNSKDKEKRRKKAQNGNKKKGKTRKGREEQNASQGKESLPRFPPA